MRVPELWATTDITLVPSVDGVCATAAYLRIFGPNAKRHFVLTGAPLPFGREPATSGRCHALINVPPLASLQAELGRAVRCGENILGVIDEHNHTSWRDILTRAGINPAALRISPMTRDMSTSHGVQSSCDVLAAALKRMPQVLRSRGPFGQLPLHDAHTWALLEAGAKADRGHVRYGLTAVTNAVVKVGDLTDRDELLGLLARGDLSVNYCRHWLGLYQAVVRATEATLEHGQFIAPGVLQVRLPANSRVDLVLLQDLAHASLAVRVLVYNQPETAAGPQSPKLRITRHSADAALDLTRLLERAGIPHTGSARRVLVPVADAERALVALCAHLRGQARSERQAAQATRARQKAGKRQRVAHRELLGDVAGAVIDAGGGVGIVNDVPSLRRPLVKRIAGLVFSKGFRFCVAILKGAQRSAKMAARLVSQQSVKTALEQAMRSSGIRYQGQGVIHFRPVDLNTLMAALRGALPT